MILLVAVLITATIVWSLLRFRRRVVSGPAPLGWMSEQWLREHQDYGWR